MLFCCCSYGCHIAVILERKIIVCPIDVSIYITFVWVDNTDSPHEQLLSESCDLGLQLINMVTSEDLLVFKCLFYFICFFFSALYLCSKSMLVVLQSLKDRFALAVSKTKESKDLSRAAASRTSTEEKLQLYALVNRYLLWSWLSYVYLFVFCFI